MSTTNKIWIMVGLLMISVGFWLWSGDYLDKMMAQREMKKQTATLGTPISDTQLDQEIDAALQADSELELKAIDSEF